MNFRDLKASEIDCRVSTINEKGLTLLLYKDARCDMNILDESGVLWQRKHYECKGNLYCSVGIYCNDIKEWVWKDDCGAESYTEKEKGEASDSFKRACFNWGIGRELYTAPFIWITPDKYNVATKNGKPTTYDRFKVTKIFIHDKKITGLEIKNTKTNKVVFSIGCPIPNSQSLAEQVDPPIQQVKFIIQQTAKRLGVNKTSDILQALEKNIDFKVDKNITSDQAEICINCLHNMTI